MRGLAVFLVALFWGTSAMAQPCAPVGGTPCTINWYVQNALTVAGNLIANGPTVNVKAPPYSAQGNTIGYQDGALTGSALTSSSATFTAADVGKYIVVHGSGTGGVPQSGTISAFVSAQAVTLSFSAVTPVTGAKFHYGTDDTAAVSAAIAVAETAGGCVFFPPGTGAYWLASQTTSISLENGCLNGAGSTENYFPYSGGSMIFVSNASTAAFNHVAGTVVKGMSFYYPVEDGSQSTPPTMPPLFEADGASNSAVNNWFSDNRVLNAWQIFHVTTAGSFARSFVTNNLMYGINDVFYMQSGFADTVELNGNYFGPGAGGVIATAGSAYPQKWTELNGSALRLDMSGGGYANADGLMINGGIVQSYRYGINLVSGTMDVSNISNVNWDSMGTILDVEGSSTVTSTSFAGGEAYSTSNFTATAAANVFNINTSTTNDSLVISGMHISFSQGGVFVDNTGSMGRLVFTGNSLNFWGRSTTTGSYYGFAELAGDQSDLTITGNEFNCNNPVGSNSLDGVLINSTAGNKVISSNGFSACTTPIQVTGTGGSVMLSGNSSTLSTNGSSDTSTSTLLAMWNANNFDLAPAPRAPTVSSCGSGASVAAGSSSQRGIINVGSGGVTACTLSLAAPFRYAPGAVSLTSSVASAVLSAPTVAYNGVSIASSADLSSGKIYYNLSN